MKTYNFELTLDIVLVSTGLFHGELLVFHNVHRFSHSAFGESKSLRIDVLLSFLNEFTWAESRHVLSSAKEQKR